MGCHNVSITSNSHRDPISRPIELKFENIPFIATGTYIPNNSALGKSFKNSVRNLVFSDSLASKIVDLSQ